MADIYDWKSEITPLDELQDIEDVRRRTRKDMIAGAVIGSIALKVGCAEDMPVVIFGGLLSYVTSAAIFIKWDQTGTAFDNKMADIVAEIMHPHPLANQE